MQYFGSIEAGGTNFICAIANEKGKIVKKVIFKTLVPKETIPKAINFFSSEHQKNKLSSIGIACFGPLNLHMQSPTYGEITTTPKPGWSYYNIVKAFKDVFSVPIGFDTDVNGAALGEQTWGAAHGIDSFIYITVGTGIGVGAIVENKLLHGLIHPEMGHSIVQRHSSDKFKSVCPYHEGCLEGLASGPSMMKRWSVESATDLDDNHKGWDLEAYYLGSAIANWTLCLSPKLVIIGGGVLKKRSLINKIRKTVQVQLNGYVKHKLILTDISKYIVLPKLEGNSGIMGAIALGQKALED